MFELKRPTALAGADLTRANLSRALLTEANLERATLVDCTVYGVSGWDLKLEGAVQSGLVITPRSEAAITVDDIEIAQFIYLLLNNQNIRRAIDTITSKVVLVLGRFTISAIVKPVAVGHCVGGRTVDDADHRPKGGPRKGRLCGWRGTRIVRLVLGFPQHSTPIFTGQPCKLFNEPATTSRFHDYGSGPLSSPACQTGTGTSPAPGPSFGAGRFDRLRSPIGRLPGPSDQEETAGRGTEMAPGCR